MTTVDVKMKDISFDDRWENTKDILAKELPPKKPMSRDDEIFNDVFSGNPKPDEYKSSNERAAFTVAKFFKKVADTKVASWINFYYKKTICAESVKKAVCDAVDVYKNKISYIKILTLAPFSKKYYAILLLKRGVEFSNIYTMSLAILSLFLFYLINAIRLPARVFWSLLDNKTTRSIIDNYFVYGKIVKINEISHISHDLWAKGSCTRPIVIHGWCNLLTDIKSVSFILLDVSFVAFYIFIINFVANTSRADNLIKHVTNKKRPPEDDLK